jgi:hypothetical protein
VPASLVAEILSLLGASVPPLRSLLGVHDLRPVDALTKQDRFAPAYDQLERASGGLGRAEEQLQVPTSFHLQTVARPDLVCATAPARGRVGGAAARPVCGVTGALPALVDAGSTPRRFALLHASGLLAAPFRRAVVQAATDFRA